MADRLDLQALLETKLGSKEVHFQPPASKSMSYPAIKYAISDIDSIFADDKLYSANKAYEVILIHPDPDNAIVASLLEIPNCRFIRYYPANNLNHYVFLIYY